MNINENNIQLILVENETTKEIVLQEYGVRVYSADGGAITFTGLLDTPTNYTGQADKLLAVNATENGVIFVDAPADAVDSVDGRTGVVTLDDLYIGVSQQTVIDSALQPNDNISELNNDSGYITSADIPADAVDSVDGRTGVVTLDDLYIGVDQQTVIDSALQPNDNISELNNNAGYITSADIPAGAVDSVDGRTGVVTLDDLYIASSEQSTIDSALQPGDAVSDLDNDAGYITSADIPADAVDSVDGRTGVVTLDDLYIGVSQQTVIDSALQPNDNISELTNDEGFITESDIPDSDLNDLTDVLITAPTQGQLLAYDSATGDWLNVDPAVGGGDVTSVDGRTGVVTLDDLYIASSEQSTIDSALQPNDNVSDLTNDAGYITSADIPADAVDSVDGRTGVVTLDDLYIASSEQSTIDSALQPNDNISELTNDEGFITESDIPDSELNDLTDVIITAPTQGQLLAYDSATGDWLNVDASAGGVTSVDGRTGVVTLDDLYIGVDQQTVIDDNTADRHTHDNKTILDGINAIGSGQIITVDERDSIAFSLHNVYNTGAGAGLVKPKSNYQVDVKGLVAGNKVTLDETESAITINADDAPVDSVDGRTGVVTLDDLYADIVHTHVEADITDLDKYTQVEVDDHIDTSMTTHINAQDPHPQYLTPQELPSTAVSWFTDEISGVNGAYLESVQEQSMNPESILTAVGDSVGVPVLMGQWLRTTAFQTAFTWSEISSTVQLDLNASNDNAEVYVEMLIYKTDTSEVLLGTSDRILLQEDRRTYTFIIQSAGIVEGEVGDRTLTRIYVNKYSGGGDPTVTLYMEGTDVSRMVTTVPIPTYPAPHASTHEIGGADQISHDLISGANGYLSHAEIDTALSNTPTLTSNNNWSGENTFTKADAGADALAIGNDAGSTTQGTDAVAVGHNAGSTAQGEHAVAIGYRAGDISQGNKSIAIGFEAGSSSQGTNSIAIGALVGATTAGASSVAISATQSRLNVDSGSLILESPAAGMVYTPTSKEFAFTNTTSDAIASLNGNQVVTEDNVPVATETTFGGFKYTFVGGVLNLITE